MFDRRSPHGLLFRDAFFLSEINFQLILNMLERGEIISVRKFIKEILFNCNAFLFIIICSKLFISREVNFSLKFIVLKSWETQKF